MIDSGDYSSFADSKLYHDQSLSGGSIMIVKDGEVYAHTDPEKHSFKNDEETINWLSNFIELP